MLSESNKEISFLLVGHSTVLINFYGSWILTDPVFSSIIGLNIFGRNIGKRRRVKPAIKIAEIPKLDLILISHAHMDHLDIKSVKKLIKKFPDVKIVTAQNTKKLFRIRKKTTRQNIFEIDWNNSLQFEGLEIQAFEPAHRGARIPLIHKDRARGHLHKGKSYNSYLITKNDKKIFFAGDTAYTENFKSVGNVDVAIMPVGGYFPNIHNHCNPEQAVMMAQDMNAKYFLPIHFGTFRMSRERFDQPIIRLQEAIKNTEIKLAISKIGEDFSIA